MGEAGKPPLRPATAEDVAAYRQAHGVRSRAVWIRPAVFGSFDGLVSVLGVLFTLGGHQQLVFWIALGLGAAECVGMTAGEWLSDSRNGFGAAAVIGGATMAGSVAPAVPYLLLSGRPAVLASVAVLVLVGLAITALRAAERGWKRAVLETYGILAVAIGAVVAIQLLTPAGA
jgi:VIT1/CCC1 family predicted Fe2+/Mn2+ transporter